MLEQEDVMARSDTFPRASSHTGSQLTLQIVFPEKPQLPQLKNAAYMGILVLTSFTSQAFIARSFQVERAAKSASAGYLQVLDPCCPHTAYQASCNYAWLAHAVPSEMNVSELYLSLVSNRLYNMKDCGVTSTSSFRVRK